jgi:hypothetical protein
VHTLITGVVKELLRKAPLTDDKVQFAWRTVAGPVLAQAATVALRDDVLHVTAKDAAWRREIERSASVIRARLEAILGERLVRQIDVRLAAGVQTERARATDRPPAGTSSPRSRRGR